MKKIFAVLIFVLLFCSDSIAFNGNTKWTFNADSHVTGAIKISGNALMFGDINGTFHALNKNSGSQLWLYKGTNTIYGTPSITSKGNVVFAQADGTITCLNPSNGSVIWQNFPEDNVNESLSDGTESGDGKIFVSKTNGQLQALDENDGRLIWTYQSGDQGLRTAPKYFDGIVFLGEYNGIFSMIDSKTGERINGGGAGGAINTPEVKDGVVYYSSWDGSLNAVKIKSVIPLWEVKLNDIITTSPSVSDGIIVVGTGTGKIIALNANDGSILWQYQTEGGEISARPLISNGLVFAGSEQGGIMIFDSKTGSIRHKIETENGINSDGEISDGVFYFGNGGIIQAVN